MRKFTNFKMLLISLLRHATSGEPLAPHNVMGVMPDSGI